MEHCGLTKKLHYKGYLSCNYKNFEKEMIQSLLIANFEAVQPSPPPYLSDLRTWCSALWRLLQIGLAVDPIPIHYLSPTDYRPQRVKILPAVQKRTLCPEIRDSNNEQRRLQERRQQIFIGPIFRLSVG